MVKKFGTENLQEGFQFVGTIVSAYWQTKEYDGSPEKEVLVIEIKPLSYTGNNRFLYISYSSRRNSKWGKFNEALEKLRDTDNFPFNPDTFTEVDLVGKTFEWASVNLDFGTYKAENFLLPIRYIPNVEQTTILQEEKEEEAQEPAQQLPPQEPVQQQQKATTFYPQYTPTPTPTSQPQEKQAENQEITNTDIVIEYLAYKKDVSINDLMQKLHLSKDVLIPILFDLSEKGIISLNGSIVHYIRQ